VRLVEAVSGHLTIGQQKIVVMDDPNVVDGLHSQGLTTDDFDHG
jgi:hypothetical protein